jgi:formylmethanofuran dehydrogenase subunit E
MNEKENWGSNLPPDLKDAELVECHQCGDDFYQETNPDDFVCNQCKREEDCDEIS